jgi:hypothetical protein
MGARRWLVVAATLVTTASAWGAHAIDPGLRCLGARTGAGARAAHALLGCEASAARKGVALAPACASDATAAFAKAYGLAGGKGGCLPDRGVARAQALLGELSAEIARRLRSGTGPDRCAARKMRAAGREARALLHAHARNLTEAGPGRLQSAAAAARSGLARAFSVAERHGSCGLDATAIGGAVGAYLDDVMEALAVVRRDTVVHPSPVAPPNTPGSAGVTVTNPKLLVQFGGAGVDLNHVTYTRWRLNGPERTPDAIVVLVPGFGGGAGDFAPLATNLIVRALIDHGLLVELWGFDRRTDQLEDRSGFLAAAALGDPRLALDWYYGAELGFTLGSPLTRRAVFYNTSDDVPFIANWTGLVLSRDIDAVVQEARAVARSQNVFLGGHSAGTDFAARYAATDFDLMGAGPSDPGYARLRGVILLEGLGGSTLTPPPSDDSLDRMIAKFDGGLFGAVRDAAPRCVDGVTPCTIPTEATDCAGQTPPLCTPSTPAHGILLGLSPKVLAAAEPAGVQALTDPNTGEAIIQTDQGAPGNNAIAKVPELAILGILPKGTVDGLFGRFLDDESITAAVSPAFAASMGAPGPTVGGLATWLDLSERASWPPCPGAGCVTPDNGPPPTALPGADWGQEKEVTRIDRLGIAFAGVEGANASDWYYPISGLSVTSVGTCSGNPGTCLTGNAGLPCTSDTACTQALSLDSRVLSADPPTGRGRRDIENLTQAAAIDIPVLCIGGSNGLVPVPGRFLPFAQSIGACSAPSCDGTPRVVDAGAPNPAFPTFGGPAGGFEVVIAEGFAHLDVVAAEDDADNPIVSALADFMARNVR